MANEKRKYKSKHINDGVYKTESWLCSKLSPSTSSVVCFDGPVNFEGGEVHQRTFIEIGSCHEKIRMFKYENDSTVDFIDKLKGLKKDINKFILYLEGKALAEGEIAPKKKRGRKKKV